jgi:CO/xanthine dehydrogenase FAD-binding subunit
MRTAKSGLYERPATVEAALSLLAKDRWTVLAGGTDFYPALRDRAVTGPVLDITAIKGLRGIRREGSDWRIGSLTTWSDVLSADLPPAFEALKLAAREVGSVQIQNRATVAGNICNASPAADGVPPLLILDAAVETLSARGQRRIALADFILGNRATALRPDEIVTGLLIPADSAQGRSHFVKLGARRYLVISIVMVAARIENGADGRVTGAAISVGACSAVAQRVPDLEKALIGHPGDESLAQAVLPAHLGHLAPIDDVRASADYRAEAACELVRRALLGCLT